MRLPLAGCLSPIPICRSASALAHLSTRSTDRRPMPAARMDTPTIRHFASPRPVPHEAAPRPYCFKEFRAMTNLERVASDEAPRPPPIHPSALHPVQKELYDDMRAGT